MKKVWSKLLQTNLSVQEYQLLQMIKEQHNPSYHISVAFELLTPVAPDLLLSGVSELMRHHTALRSYYLPHNPQEFNRYISEIDTLPIQVLSCKKTTKLQNVHNETCNPLFIVEEAPLWRGKLILHDGKVKYLFLCFHHLIFDYTSLLYFLHHLSLYLQNNSNAGSMPPDNYAQLIPKQRSYLHSKQHVANQKYWREQLQNYQTLELSGKPRATIAEYVAESCAIYLTADQVGLILERLTDRKLFFAFLTTCLQASMHTIFKQPQLLCRVPVDGRSLNKDIQAVIGYLAYGAPYLLPLNGQQDMLSQTVQNLSSLLWQLKHSSAFCLSELIQQGFLPRCELNYIRYVETFMLGAIKLKLLNFDYNHQYLWPRSLYPVDISMNVFDIFENEKTSLANIMHKDIGSNAHACKITFVYRKKYISKSMVRQLITAFLAKIEQFEQAQ